MAKTLNLSTVTSAALLAELALRLNAKPEGASAGEEFPNAEAIDGFDLETLQEWAGKLSIEIDDKDEDELKALLTTAYEVGANIEDINTKALKNLMTELGLKYVKDDLDANLATVKEYLNADAEGAEAEGEDDAESGDDAEESEESADEEASEDDAGEDSEEAADEEAEGDDDDAEEASEEDAEEADEDDGDEEESEAKHDPAEVVKANAKYPKEEIMVKRLTAFNKVAKKKLDVKKLGGAKKAYAKLLELLVDDAGELAAWGAAYVKDGEGYCSGLSMTDVKLKGDKTEYGKCQVTGALYSADDEGNFVKKEA